MMFRIMQYFLDVPRTLSSYVLDILYSNILNLS
jgi:hypothetical protein